MRERFSNSSGDAYEVGQIVAREFLQEPVKEAVREALEEERAERGQSAADEESTSNGGGSTFRTVLKLLVPIVGLAAVALAAKRRRGRSSGGGGPGFEEGSVPPGEYAESTTVARGREPGFGGSDDEDRPGSEGTSTS